MDLIFNRMVIELWSNDQSEIDLVPPKTPVTLAKFIRKLPKLYRDRFIERDPWGGAYMIGNSNTLQIWVGSGGEDRYLGSIKNFELAIEQGEAVSTQRDLIFFIEDDIVMTDREIVYGPIKDLDRIKRSMAGLRSIGTAIESFSIDENYYPVQDAGLATVTLLEGDLEPVYIRTLPLFDDWGQPFLVWSNGEQFVVLSMGADGILDPQTRSGVTGAQARGGATTDPNADIIFANGQFTQWPEGTQQ